MFFNQYLISGLLIACAIPASATMTTYCVPGPSCTFGSNSAASSQFNSDTSSDTFQNLTFSAGSLGSSYTDPTTGLAFSDPLGLLGIASPSGWPSGTAIEGNSTGAGTTETLTVPSGVNAIDFYVGMLDYSYFTISVTDSTGGTFTSGYFSSSPTSPQFFGVTTTGYITSFTITSQAGVDKITLDGISVGESDMAPVPETATMLLVGTGLLLIGFGRRWMPARGAQAGSLA